MPSFVDETPTHNVEPKCRCISHGDMTLIDQDKDDYVVNTPPPTNYNKQNTTFESPPIKKMADLNKELIELKTGPHKKKPRISTFYDDQVNK